MILAMGALLLQIPAIPQNSISTVSTATAGTTGAAAPDTTTKSVSSDGTEPVNPAPASESPTAEELSQGPDLSARGAFATPVPLSPLQDPSKKVRRREWLALSIAQHSAATFDAWSTRQVISSGQARELNPMLRPFAGNGSLYAVIQVGSVLFDYLGRHMMTSQHGWMRRTWWIPQAVNSVVLLTSGAHNLSVH
jgi:hypothetical protein